MGHTGSQMGPTRPTLERRCPNIIHKMNTVVLALQELTEPETITKAQSIAQGLTDHAAAFTGAEPTAAQITAAADLAEAKLGIAAIRQQEAEAATMDKNNAMEALRLACTKVAGCDAVKALDPAVCALVFKLKAAPTTTTNMAKVITVKVTFGDKTTELDLIWPPIPQARSYELQTKLTGGTWTHAKISTSSSTTLKSLPTGTVVQIRIRAIGPNDLEGEWSDPIEHLVP